ncbi:MAG: hypothetical protein Q8R02_02600 [Hyphomonadaceae bacterium]|nr:hypothetical protein [Hyphomonadaceae bacterium]
MFAPAHDFFRAIHKAGKATRRGNYAEADRWTRIAERHLQMAKRFEDLIPKPPARPKERPVEYNPPDPRY